MYASKEVKIRILELQKLNDNMTLYQLSIKSGVPMTTLMNIMKDNNPTISTINKICFGFSISLSEFFSSDNFNKIEPEERERNERKIQK